jgi:F-type H+-transporting ATPase subunit b
MQDIFDQLGNLLLGSVPTILLFIVLVLAYRFLVQNPLTATLKERRARTAGAVEAAHNAIAEAEAKAADYAERLRLARAEAYRAREQRMKQLSVDREAALDAARKAAGETVNKALVELEGEAAAARKTIQTSVGELARQVVRAVLPVAAGGTS